MYYKEVQTDLEYDQWLLEKPRASGKKKLNLFNIKFFLLQQMPRNVFEVNVL